MWHGENPPKATKIVQNEDFRPRFSPVIQRADAERRRTRGEMWWVWGGYGYGSGGGPGGGAKFGSKFGFGGWSAKIFPKWSKIVQNEQQFPLRETQRFPLREMIEILKGNATISPKGNG